LASVRAATLDDLDQWLEIVREVEPLFGPMPDFAVHAQRAIERGTALVATVDGRVCGACILSPHGTPQEIRWLAVRGADRRHGIGSFMVDAVEERWPTGAIAVVTFAESSVDGRPARRLYEARGFENRGPTDPGPDGSARDLYVLTAEKRDTARFR